MCNLVYIAMFFKLIHEVLKSLSASLMVISVFIDNVCRAFFSALLWVHVTWIILISSSSLLMKLPVGDGSWVPSRWRRL